MSLVLTVGASVGDCGCFSTLSPGKGTPSGIVAGTGSALGEVTGIARGLARISLSVSGDTRGGGACSLGCATGGAALTPPELTTGCVRGGGFPPVSG